MKLKSSLHRSAIVLAGAIVGLVGVAVVAGPASAHTATVSGTTTCINGKNVVTWTLTNDWVDKSGATVENLKLPAGDAPVRVDPKASDKDLTLHEGTVLSAATLKGWKKNEVVATSVQYTQTVDQAATATLTFDAHWTDDDHYQRNNTATVNLKQGCTPPAPRCVDAEHAAFSHTFVVDKVGGTTVINLKDNVNLCADVKIPVTSVSYYAPKPQFDVPQYLFDKDSGNLTNTQRTLKLWVATPPCYTQVDTFFGTENDIIPSITTDSPRYGDKKLGSAGAPGNKSTGPPAWYNGGDNSCVTPASTSVPSCDGTQVINLSNSGKYDETFTVKYDDQVKTVVVGAGQGSSVTVPVNAGPVTVSAEGMKDQTYTWAAPQDCALPTVTITNTCTDVTITVTNPKGVTTADALVTYGKDTKEVTVAAGTSQRATFTAGSATYATVKIAGLDSEIKAALKKLVCATPTATTGGSGGGTLPITGSAAGSVAAGAVVLLLAGGVAFFVARRRKVRFTA